MTTEIKETDAKEIDLFPAFMAVLAARWIILRNFVIVVVVVAAATFIMPKKYTAVATLMPPQDEGKLGMSGMLADVSVPGLSLPASASSADILVEMLKSRSVGERVLRREFAFDGDSLQLYQGLKMPSVDVGLLRMRKTARFLLSKQNMISIVVEVGDAPLAAHIANAYVEELDRINQQKSVSRAKNSRLYIESQLERTQLELRTATQKLAEFQQKNKAVSLENQMQSSIQQAGELKGQIIAKQVEIGVMRQSMKSQNPLVIRAQSELNELKRRYAEFQYGDEDVAVDDSEFYLPFADVPEVALRLAELIRNVKVQETVWQLLNQQYFQAKIEEARNTPTVQVLDKATPPPFPSSPNKKAYVIVFGLLSIVMTKLWILLMFYWDGIKRSPEKQQRLDILKNELDKDKTRFNSIRKK
jgi:tyrosine-protein kinase Etk/Wzc